MSGRGKKFSNRFDSKLAFGLSGFYLLIGATFLLCITVLLGWAIDVVELRSILPSAPQTTPLTAILILILSFALFCLAQVKQSKSIVFYRLAGIFFCVVSIGICVYTIVQYINHLPSGIETFFFTAKVKAQSEVYPGRPSPHTLAASLLASLAILLLFTSIKTRYTISSIINIMGFVVPWLALVGYLSYDSTFYAMGEASEIGMSPVTAICFILLFISVFLLYRNRGVVKLLKSKSTGGIALKFFLPFALLLPLVLGSVMVLGKELGLYSYSSGLVLNRTILSIVWAVLVFIGANTLDRYEKVKEKNYKEKLAVEREKNKLTNDLILRNKSLEQFAYIVSHNLRMPVANLITLSEAINQDIRDGNNVEEMLLEGLKESSYSLDTIIRDLNEILQVRNSFDEVKREISFSALLSDIKLGLQSQIQKYDVDIQSDFEVESYVTLKSYLQSIFHNLISNSIKFRREDIPCNIVVSTQRVDDKLLIVFRDNGLGIDMKRNKEKVFGLYKRFNLEKEGRGMGLYMVKTQVETLGGSISLKSEPNKGCEFRIELPL